MLDYRSTHSFESVTTEGVTFEIHKPSTARNIEFNRTNAAFRLEARDLQAEINRNQRKLDEHARAWQREQDAKYAKAKAVWAATSDASTPEAEGAQTVIAGYEADRELARMREQLGKFDLDALAGVAEDDARVVEVNELLKRMEQTAAVATSYVEPDELAEERIWLRRQSEFLMDESYRPARIRWGVASIAGLTIDGKPVTVESQLQSGPPDLTSELFARVEEVARFSPDKLKKSSSPTISSGQEGGSATSTTATPASEANSTPAETAKSISLS